MKFTFLLLSFAFTCTLTAQNKSSAAVEQQVASLTKAIIDADKPAMEALVMDGLSYGHSAGLVENKQEMIERIVSGKSDFVTMEISGQTIQVSGKTAIVRHELHATTNDLGKPGEVKLKVLMVWQKSGGKWKLLARQAVKLT